MYDEVEDEVEDEVVVITPEEAFRSLLTRTPRTLDVDLDSFWLEHLDFDANTDMGKQLTPMHLACSAGKLQIVRSLLKHGARIDMREKRNGLTALHIACARPRLPILRCMLDACPTTLGVRDDFERTPLHTAAEAGRPDLIALLLERGADVFAVDLDGRTPLHVAAAEGHAAAIAALLALHQRPWGPEGWRDDALSAEAGNAGGVGRAGTGPLPPPSLDLPHPLYERPRQQRVNPYAMQARAYADEALAMEAASHGDVGGEGGEGSAPAAWVPPPRTRAMSSWMKRDANVKRPPLPMSIRQRETYMQTYGCDAPPDPDVGPAPAPALPARAGWQVSHARLMAVLDLQGMTALQVAEESGRTEAVEALTSLGKRGGSTFSFTALAPPLP